MPFADVAWAIADLEARLPALQRRRAYYEGRHDKVLPDSKTLSRVLRDLLDDLNDNLCDDVVDDAVERCEVTAITGRNDGQGKKATDWWDEVRGPARMRDTLRTSLWAGDGFTIIQRNSQQKVRKYVQRPEQMAVRYSEDDPDTIEVAAKVWKVGKKWRITLYYSPMPEGGPVERPDGIPADKPWIERYISKGSGSDGACPQAKQFDRVADHDGVGLPWEPLDGDRVPVFHYPEAEVGRYGRSVLTDVIPLQNVLNKSVSDLVVAMEGHSLPIRWATGIQVEYDPVTGDEKALWRPGVERLVRTGSKDAAFGQFDAADLTGFLNVQSMIRLEIARKGKLPLHSVSLEASGNAPSGLALLVSETRLIKRVTAMQEDDGTVLREELAYALSLAGTPTVAADLNLEWEPAATKDEASEVTVLQTKVESLGLPKDQALLELGYDQADVDRWSEDRQAAADAIGGGRLSPAGAPGTLPPPPGPTLVPNAPQSPPGAPAATA